MKTFILDNIVINMLDRASQILIRFTVLVAVFVAFLSAMFGAATFSELCFDGNHFWPIAAIWFICMLVIEGIILGSDLNNKSVLKSRIAICILLGCFHSLALDQYIFDDSVNNYLTRQYNTEVAILDSTYRSEKIAPLLAREDALRSQNQALNREVKRQRDRYNIEVTEGANGRGDGNGPYAKFKLNEYKRDSTRAAKLKSDNNARIKDLSTEIDSLNSLLVKQKEQIVKPEQAGMLDFINALYYRIFVKGTILDILLFSLIFLAGIAIESLTLLAKLGFSDSFEKYHEEVDRQRERLSNKYEREHTNKDKLDEIKQTKAFNEEISSIEQEIQLDSIRDSKQLELEQLKARFKAVKRKAALILEALGETDEMDEEIQEIMNGNGTYEKYAKPLVTEYRLNKIEEIVDDLNAQKD